MASINVKVIDLTPFVLRQLPKRQYYITSEEIEKLIPVGWFRGWIIDQRGDWVVAHIGKEVVVLSIENLSFFVRDENGRVFYEKDGKIHYIPFAVIPE